jgi:DNA-binding CsgD family transcriptional regulator
MAAHAATAAPLASPQARRAYARILNLGRQRRADQMFLEELSHELRLVVPFDGAFWGAADPLTTLATSPARVENLASAEACAAYWECEFLVEDFIHFRDLARAERPAASLDRATGGRPARSVRYRAVNRLLGYGDELRAVFRADRGAWGFVSLWRHEDVSAFSAGEEKLLADLSSPLASAFRRAALVRDQISDVPQDAPGLLTFDEHGVLESLNEQAEEWLRELEPTVALGERGAGELPTEVLTVSARARAIAAGLDGGVARARTRTRTGRWLIVHGFRLRGTGGEDGRTALVIEPARSSQIAPIIAAAYQLTRREQEVVQLLSYGLSTGEVADRLYLSPHTVRDYVKQVFEKVGVSSRGELVAKIFAEHYAQPLQADIVHERVDAADGAESGLATVRRARRSDPASAGVSS